MLSEPKKIRVKFSKTGNLKFISHLDLNRTVKSAFIRSKLPIWYTQGFNPHPKTVFSLPLSVGTASLCEFMDFRLCEELVGEAVCERLNAVFPEGLHAIAAYAPQTKFSEIGWADYEIRIEAVPSGEEEQRIREVLPAVVKGTGLPVSVDTFYPQVAWRALEAGACILNDVSGFGEEMLQVAAGSRCGCVVMDPGGGEGEVLRRVKGFFLSRLQAAEALGISRERLCFDPGVGFGKTMEDNLALIARAGAVKVEGCALLMAASRKRVTGFPCGNPPFQQRLPATLAAHTAAVLAGADMLRVHDVKEAVQAARMADALKGCL